MRHCLPFFLLFSAIVHLSGCAAYRDYDSEMQQTIDEMAKGELNEALYLLELHNPWEDKDLLYYLERGAILSAGTALPQSQEAWRTADRMIFQREEANPSGAMKLLTRFGNEMGTMLVNDKLLRYEGYDYEKVMLTTEMALNQLAENDFDGARADIKNTHERETLIARQRERQYEEAEEQAKSQGITLHYKDLQGYPVAVLDAPQVVELKNGYQSAFSHYLAGFTYEALGERGLAAPGYRQAIELRPGVPFLEKALRNLDKPPPAADESEVLVVVQAGFAPARSSVQVPIPVRLNENLTIVAPISFPVMLPDTITPPVPSVLVDGQQYPLTMINSVTDMAMRTLRDDMPAIISRAMFRANMAAISQAQENERNPAKASLVVTEHDPFEEADTRTWRTLPDKTLVARLRLKKGLHRVRFPYFRAEDGFTVRVDQHHQVLNLRVFMGKNYYVGSTLVLPEAPAPTNVASAGQ
ncbi:COG3014 family protein [Pseudomonas sp. RA_105y_Pfl2_P56]|uniref:COG3014 family protein n=1 Tax=Pseudomonas sp. RA_105y_Pfl2_P56 TaxID=3088701 RepID=UPI0030DD48F3